MLKCSAFPLLLKRKEIAVIGYCKKTFEEEAREIDAAGSLIVMELNISYFQPSNQKVTNVEDSLKNYMVMLLKLTCVRHHKIDKVNKSCYILCECRMMRAGSRNSPSHPLPNPLPLMYLTM